MESLNKEIGIRLKLIRELMNEGEKLSAVQLAHLVGENRDKIANYESGRAGVPARVLKELYLRGININYIISGEGDIFAGNDAGKLLKQKIDSKSIQTKAKLIGKINKAKLPPTTKIHTVAAGFINKSENESDEKIE